MKEQPPSPKLTQFEEKLSSYSLKLPDLPCHLNIPQYDQQILDIEPDWNKFFGEKYTTVKYLSKKKEEFLLTTYSIHKFIYFSH